MSTTPGFVTFHDNSEVAADRLAQLPKLADHLLDRTLGDLRKDPDRSKHLLIFPATIKDSELGDDQYVLRHWNGKIWTSNVMGFIGQGPEQLRISSRFAGGGDERDFFLQYLILKALRLPNISSWSFQADSTDAMLDLLVLLFPASLKQAMRTGIYRTYIRREYNDGNIKGTIDVARHLRLNTPFVGKVAYNQRELSPDNHVTELIRHTIEFIRTKPYGNSLLRSPDIRDLVEVVVTATPRYRRQDQRRVIIDNQKTPVRHAFHRDYRSLQQLCLKILQHDKLRFEQSEQEVYGLLFDGAWLWEEYVNTLIGDIGGGFWHPQNRAGELKQHLFAGGTGLIYPDFISKAQLPTRVIADAKYKPTGNIHGSDYLQVLAYMYRFESRRGLYLYPWRREDATDDKGDTSEEAGAGYVKREFSLLGGLNSPDTSKKLDRPERAEEVILCKLGLQIPQVEEWMNFSAFMAAMRKNEEAFTTALRSFVEGVA